MYGSQAWVDWLPYICLLFSGFSNVYHSACVWPTALKLVCNSNFFLMMGFISLVDEIQFMLISSHHICIRSMGLCKTSNFSILWMLAIWNFAPVLTAAVYIARWGWKVRMEKFAKLMTNSINRPMSYRLILASHVWLSCSWRLPPNPLPSGRTTSTPVTIIWPGWSESPSGLGTSDL